MIEHDVHALVAAARKRVAAEYPATTAANKREFASYKVALNRLADALEAEYRAHDQTHGKLAGAYAVIERILQTQVSPQIQDIIATAPVDVLHERYVTLLESVITDEARDHWEWAQSKREKSADAGCVCALCGVMTRIDHIQNRKTQ